MSPVNGTAIEDVGEEQAKSIRGEGEARWIHTYRFVLYGSGSAALSSQSRSSLLSIYADSDASEIRKVVFDEFKHGSATIQRVLSYIVSTTITLSQCRQHQLLRCLQIHSPHPML